jgi:threonine/homoserine/homoserine lactone efflux protein
MIENIIKILITNGIVMVVPGLNFYLISDVSMNKGMKFGLATAFGVTFAITIHVVFAMFGSYKFYYNYPQFFEFIKTAGVIYILWLAFKLLKSSWVNKKVDNQNALGSTFKNCFLNGFYIDLLNPYITIFYFSLFSQIINNNEAYMDMFIYALVIFLLVTTWYSLVVFLFSRHIMREFFYKNKKLVERLCAIALTYFAIKLYIA